MRVDQRATDASLADPPRHRRPAGVGAPRPACRPPPAGRRPTATESTAWTTPFGHVDGAALQAELVDPTRRCRSRQPGGELLADHRTSADPGCDERRRRCSGARRRRADPRYPARRVRGRAGADRDHGRARRPPPATAATPTSCCCRPRSPRSATSPAPRCRPRSTPGAATTCCAIDGVPIPVRVRGSVADALAGGAVRRDAAATTPRCVSTTARTASPPTASRGPGCRSTASCSRPTWSSRPRPRQRRRPQPTPPSTSSDRVAPHGAGRRLPRRVLAGARRGLPRRLVGVDRRRFARPAAARRRRLQRVVDPAEQHGAVTVAHRAGPPRSR